MSYLVLARKYRPQTFDEVIGQDHVTRTLKNAIAADRVPHAVLFSGPRGTGKTTVARILAKAMNCEKGPTETPCNACRSCGEITAGSAVDVFEIDGASNNSVEQVRELRGNIKYMPAHSRYKIYIIDEVHMLSVAAFNALLKTLEEPPAHIMFLFATTEPHKIPLTILSRCQLHDLKRIDIELISSHLKMLCEKEGVNMGEDSLLTVAGEAEGSMRDALSLLDQVMASVEGDVVHENLIELLGLVDRKQIFDISSSVFTENTAKILEIIGNIYDRGHDVKKLYSDIIAHFRNLLVVKMGGAGQKLVDLPKHEIEQLKVQVEDIPLTYLNQILDFLFSAEASIRYSEQPKLSLELVFLKLMQIKPALPIEDLIEKLDLLRREIKGPGYSSDVNADSAGEKEGREMSKHDDAASYPEGEAVSPATEKIVSDQAGSFDKKSDMADVWRHLFECIKKDHPSIAANLAQSGLKQLGEKDIDIEINGNDFNINMIKKEKNLAILQQVCDEFFGRKMNIVIHEKKAPNDLKKQNNTIRSLKQDALNHPLVSDAVEIFNGKIVDVEVLKPDKE